MNNPRYRTFFLLMTIIVIASFGCNGQLSPLPSVPSPDFTTTSKPSTSKEMPTTAEPVTIPTESAKPSATAKLTPALNRMPPISVNSPTLLPGWEQYQLQDYSLEYVWGTSLSDVFVVGESGTILHWDSNEWTVMDSATAADLYEVWGTAPDNVFAVGEHGTILHYDGMFWSPMESSTTERIIAIGGSSSRDIVAFTQDADVLIYDGVSWKIMDRKMPQSTLLWDAWANSSTNIFLLSVGYIVAEYNMAHYDGIGWIGLKCQSDDSKAHLLHIWGSSSGNLFAAGDGGVILRFDGQEWKTIKDDFPTFVGGGWANSPSDVFVVGWKGVITHYDGETWHYFDNGVSVPIVGVWGSIDSEIFAVGRGGTILHYTCSGE